MTRAADCMACEKGTFCPVGSKASASCRAGTYNDQVMQETCKPCPAGSLQDAEGATGCKQCKGGSYCPLGASAPLPCEQGSYSNATNLTSANECTWTRPGFYAPTGSVEQTVCSAGTFAPAPQQAKCELCPPGKISAEGSTGCTSCPPTSYAASQGQGQCTPCPHRLSSPQGAISCSFCDDGFYLRDESIDRSMLLTKPQLCRPCPARAVCTQNTTMSTLGVPYNHWRLSLYSDELHRCPARGDVAHSSCRGSANITIEGNEDVTQYCIQGHRGPRCEGCVLRNQYYNKLQHRCVDCPPSWRIAVYFSVILAVTILMAAIWRAYRKTKHYTTHKRRLAAAVHSMSLRAKAKILLSFYQVRAACKSSKTNAALCPKS